MLLQILAACPAPWSPARMVARDIGCSACSTAAKSASSHPTMKPACRRQQAAVPAGDRRIGEAVTGGLGLGRDGAGALHVDGGAVDQQRRLRRVGQDLLGVDLPDVRSGRQHGDDHLAAVTASATVAAFEHPAAAARSRAAAERSNARTSRWAFAWLAAIPRPCCPGR
jgi:hypothetical protein